MSLYKTCSTLIVIAGLSACTHYHSKPLQNPASITRLTQADKNALIQQAASLQHERLPPIQLNFKKPFTAQELAVIAVLFNPDLKALRAKEGVSQAQVFDAGLLPDPQFGFVFDKPLHQTDPETIPFSSGYLVGLSWDFAGLITRKTKIDIAAAKYQQVHYDVAWQEWLLANQAELLATRVYFLQKQVRLAKEAIASANFLLEITRKNMQKHDAKIDEYALRQSAYLDFQDQLQTLQRTLISTELQLNQVLGLNPSEIVPLSLPKTISSDHLNASRLFEEASQNRLDLIALRAGYESQEKTIYQGILSQFPHFNLGLTRGRDTGDVNSVGLTLTFDIPLFNRNQGVIAIAYATREQLNLEYQARLHQTQTDIAVLVADLRQIRIAEQILEKQLPNIRKAERLMAQGLKSGNVTEISYQDVKAGLFNKELRLLNLKQNRAEQMIALQIALGRLWKEGAVHVS